MTAYQATVNIPDGGAVTVSATYGTQAVGYVSGNPLDDTDPGTVDLAVFPRGAGGAAVIMPRNVAVLVAAALDIALSASDSRDHRDDVIKPVTG